MIRIPKGDADTLTETVTGLSSLSGYTAKLYLYDNSGTLKLTETGTIATLTISYDITNEDTKSLAVGKYFIETKIFDAADHVYTLQRKKPLIIDYVYNSDPS